MDNVAFVWHAATNVFTNGADITQWWPGGDVVDWIGMSFFTFDGPSWESLARVAHENQRPVMICEAAPQGFDIVNLTQGSVSGNGSDRWNVSEDDVWNNWFHHFFSFIENEKSIIRAISVSHHLRSAFRCRCSCSTIITRRNGVECAVLTAKLPILVRLSS